MLLINVLSAAQRGLYEAGLLVENGIFRAENKKMHIFSKKSAEKFAGKEKSRTFATRLRKNGSSLTSLRKDNEVKLEDEIKIVCNE